MGSQKHRVVVTGLGMVTALGTNVPTTWKAILGSKSGAQSIRHFDASNLPCQFSAFIENFQLATFSNRIAKILRKTDLFIQYGMNAAREAILDAGLALTENLDDANRIGVSVGSGIGGLSLIEQQHLNLQEIGFRRVSPFFIPGTIINMVSGLISIEYGFKGPNLATVTACTTGTHNIGLAARLIAYGDADVMVAGGTEMASTPLGMAGFAACRALSTRNADPARASRPWDQDRDGFVLGDGAGVLVLESYEHAKARGAHIYAELRGFGMSADAHDMTSPAPNGEGASQAMRRALQDAEMTPEVVDYINAHATSTQLGDIAELQAIKNTFADHANQLLVSATKSMTGHLLGAAGAIEAAFCGLAIRDHIAPPTINLDKPSEGCDLNLVPHIPQEKHIKVALSNSFGFGGTNGSLIFSAI